MNILEVKQEVENTVRAYLQKDARGSYCFPSLRQRPLLLMGPPGIGKTAIMAQIAQTLGIGLVSYTMTHHTRQSAIGLPQIADQTFDGDTFSVTRYTMSEIIGAVYESMAKSGIREGILFLDEINCVSDTLAPTMLQFLQNKTFGTHRLPEGWVIVAAGNPPEYNKSVREFDVVTLDRVRIMEVEPNTEVFLDYGMQRGLHGAILSWLRLNPQTFYHVSRHDNSFCYVTARGWEDLSALLLSYEALNIPVSEEVISQFLHLPETCRAFYSYYSLYRKYGMDYGIPEILSGQITPEAYRDRCALAAQSDLIERFAVTEMLLQGMRTACAAFAGEAEAHDALRETLSAFSRQTDSLDSYLCKRREALETKQKFALLSPAEQHLAETTQETLEALLLEMKQARAADPSAFIQKFLTEENTALHRQAEEVQIVLSGGIRFLRDSLGDGQELTALLSGMTVTPVIMRFIAQYGCPEYLAVCGLLEIHRQEESLRESCKEAAR